MDSLLLLLLALLGHAFLWIALVNRMHAVSMPRRFVRVLTLLCLACLVAVPLSAAWWFAPAGSITPAGVQWRQVSAFAWLYLGTCWVAAAVTILRWIRWHLLHRPPAVLRFHRTRSLELAVDSAGPVSDEHAHHFLVHLPGNQILRLDMTERVIDLPRLDRALDGLSILHVSDFHFTGRVGKAYFQEVVRHGNQVEPDLVAITGDLVDAAKYIDWLPETVGKLRARYGVYYVLGNHDARVNCERLHRVLQQSGLVALGGRWIRIEVRGRPVVLAGNELPWLPPAADMTDCPPRGDGGPLRIVLAHSPDQFDWARGQDADLLLAGHTHGGQIRFPLIGPVLSPSRTGVKYASGVFYAPPTIMHVTRGVSGEFPIRLNCPPEMTHLMLHAMEQPDACRVGVDGCSPPG